MRDAAGQLADGLHLLRLDELELEPAAAGHVLRHPDEVQHVTGGAALRLAAERGPPLLAGIGGAELHVEHALLAGAQHVGANPFAIVG